MLYFVNISLTSCLIKSSCLIMHKDTFFMADRPAGYFPIYNVWRTGNGNYKIHVLRVRIVGGVIDDDSNSIEMDGLSSIPGIELDHMMGYNVIITASPSAMMTIFAPGNKLFFRQSGTCSRCNEKSFFCLSSEISTKKSR